MKINKQEKTPVSTRFSRGERERLHEDAKAAPREELVEAAGEVVRVAFVATSADLRALKVRGGPQVVGEVIGERVESLGLVEVMRRLGWC